MFTCTVISSLETFLFFWQFLTLFWHFSYRQTDRPTDRWREMKKLRSRSFKTNYKSRNLRLMKIWWRTIWARPELVQIEFRLIFSKAKRAVLFTGLWYLWLLVVEFVIICFWICYCLIVKYQFLWLLFNFLNDRQTNKVKNRISNQVLLHDALNSKKNLYCYFLTCLYFTIILFLRFMFFGLLGFLTSCRR